MFPTINLNGTSPEELINAIEDASYAISLAYEALEKTAPHERDYPDKNLRRAYSVDGTGKRAGKSRIFVEPKLVEARYAIQADLTALRNILLRLQSVWANIDDQTTTQRLHMAQAEVDRRMAAYNNRRKK